jgi:hypothetical protein
MLPPSLIALNVVSVGAERAGNHTALVSDEVNLKAFAVCLHLALGETPNTVATTFASRLSLPNWLSGVRGNIVK